MSPTATEPRPVDPLVRIGHVHLKVADLERAISFYRDVLGFELTQRYGPGAAFLSAGGYHHHIGLNTWESRGGPAPAATPPPVPSISGRRRRDLTVCLVVSYRKPSPGPENAYCVDPGDDPLVDQRASAPRSPVRTRTTVSTGLTHTFPSPILPVRAACTMTSTTLSTAEYTAESVSKLSGVPRDRLEALARRCQFRYRRLYVWPTRHSVANALVLGLMLATAQASEQLAIPVNDLEAKEDAASVWRREINDNLAWAYQHAFARLEAELRPQELLLGRLRARRRGASRPKNPGCRGERAAAGGCGRRSRPAGCRAPAPGAGRPWSRSSARRRAG